MTEEQVFGQTASFGRAGRWIGLVLGPALAFGIYALGPPDGLGAGAWAVVALSALMVAWWITEAAPIAMTALMPLIVLPLAGAVEFGAAAAPYADRIIFLFIGGFILAKAIERWRLHERIALAIAARAGDRPAAMVGGFMLAAALLSMWISNTATTLMLISIALGAARALAPDGKPDLAFGGALTLGVAHAATIGGVGTPVGTPTNLIAIAFLKRAGEPVAFVDWMAMALPYVLVMLPLAWALLCAPLFGRRHDDAGAVGAAVRAALSKLGPVSGQEVRVALVFAAVALSWMFRPILNTLPGLGALSDPGIALGGALALFLVPSGRGGGEALISWTTAERIPWGIVILFGGGLSLAAAMESTGLAAWIGAAIGGLDGVSALGLIAILVIATILVSELASNVATLTSMMPVLAAVASATDAPLAPLAYPVAIAASFAFMLPVATAPNAIAYASGVLTLKRMLAVGVCLNVAAATLIISRAAL